MEKLIEEYFASLREAVSVCTVKANQAGTELDKRYWEGARNAYSNAAYVLQREFKNLQQPDVVVSGQQECYKTGAPCKYGCEGLCKDSC